MNSHTLNMHPPSSITATPTYSADRARLPGDQKVASIEEARKIASTWDITGSRYLTRSADMDDLIGSCSDENGSVDLGILLKKCYETAFYMPPSPSALSRSPLIGKPGGGNSPPDLDI